MTIRERLEEDFDNILNKVQNGDSTIKIAQYYNCNPGSIWYFLKDKNINLNKKRTKYYGNSAEYKNQIIDLFNQGYGSYKIAKQLDIPKCTILRWLSKWGYDLSFRRKDNPDNLLKDKIDKVIQLHKAGKTCTFIAKELGHSQTSVMELLSQHGFDTSFTYEVDESFFEKIDNENKAYILGWMYSDGNVMPEGRLRISLNIKDEEIIIKIKNILKYEGPLYYKKKRKNSEKQVELCIGRKKMTDDLLKLGVMPAKSLIIEFPTFEQVPINLIHHFIRGVFDGDGSLSNGIMICGSFNFTRRLAEILPCNITNIYQRYKDRKSEDSAHQLFIGRKIEIIKFITWLYKDSSIFLDRKKSLVEDYLKGV